MARFRFELESVLRARKIVEREKQRAVAEIEAERLEYERQLRQYQSNIVSGKQSIRRELVGSLDIDQLRTRAGVSLQAVRRAQEIVMQLAGVHRRLEAARVELAMAARDRRAIEILREERFAAWKAAIEKKEVEAIDELAIIKAGRKSRRDGTEFDSPEDDECAA